MEQKKTDESFFKISVIIPCYNVQEYIDRCLELVTNQSIGLEHLEIILIDDASTDGTLEKMLQWERKFPDQIIVITYEENLRQGGARNVGLRYATGEYIGFVDSDDCIDHEMYEVLHSQMSLGSYDAVNCQLIRMVNNDKPSDFKPEWGGIVTGLYTRELVLEHDVWFPEHMAYEDNYWGPLIRHYAKRILKVERALYYYYVNRNSTVMGRNQLHQLDRMEIEKMLLEEYIQRGIFDNEKDQIFDEFFEMYYLNTWFIIFTRFDDIPDVLPEMRRTIGKFYPDYEERLKQKKFSCRNQLLVDMLLNSYSNVYIIKLNWMKDWLAEQGITL